MSKNVSKKHMAECMGYEYCGKGFNDSGDDGFIVRECGTTNYISIGNTMEQATEWLEEGYNIYIEDLRKQAELQLLVGTEDTILNISYILVSLGYSDICEVGNIEECIEEHNSICASYLNELTEEYEEICIEFNIVKLWNKEEYETCSSAVVIITGILNI